MKIREFIKLLTPPILLNGYFNWRDILTRNSTIYLTGEYSSWQSALVDSVGYDAEIILEKTKDALLKVKNGEAIYERDSVLFNEIQYSWSLLAGLMWVAACTGGRLNVLDYGGSLGSTYYQNRAFLTSLREVKWNIVEQSKHVDVGKQLFENDQLKFYANIEACLLVTQPQLILLSSVLQYLCEPYCLLDQLSNLPCEYMIIDRTPFFGGEQDRLCLQHVPTEIYKATYPSWIFSMERIRTHLRDHWNIIAEFDSFDKLSAPVAASWKGIIAIKKRGKKSYG